MCIHSILYTIFAVNLNFGQLRIYYSIGQCADHTHQCCFAGTICTKQTIDTVRHGIAEIVYGNMALIRKAKKLSVTGLKNP